MIEQAGQITELIKQASTIVIMQADNPDGDSLGCAVALENIIGDLGKTPYMYCGVQMPSYLHYISGWDRVNDTLPAQFDLSIIVDTSADSLFETMNMAVGRSIVASKPVIVIDHHDVEPTIDYATVLCIQPAVAAAQVIYELSRQLSWPLNDEACAALAAGIMSDSLGLTSVATSARSIHIIGELVEQGVRLAELDNARRDLSRKSPAIVRYKGNLLERIEYAADGRLAMITIPWDEIEMYSQEYNPSVLVIDEMRGTIGVRLAIAFKLYKDGKITAKIRCNYGTAIAGKLAEHFGGGGHPYASGFKVQGRSLDDIKRECISYATELLNIAD